MIKKNGIRLTRRTKSIKQDSHTPLQRMHGYRCRRMDLVSVKPTSDMTVCIQA